MTGWKPLFISSWFRVGSRSHHICQCRCAWKHVRLAGETWWNYQPNLQTLLHPEPRHPNSKTNNTTIFIYFLSCTIEFFKTLVWVYSLELLLRFYHKVSILIVALASTGHWCISLTYIGLIAKPKQPQQKWMSTQFFALHGEIPPVVCLDTVNHCYCDPDLDLENSKKHT